MYFCSHYYLITFLPSNRVAQFFLFSLLLSRESKESMASGSPQLTGSRLTGLLSSWKDSNPPTSLYYIPHVFKSVPQRLSVIILKAAQIKAKSFVQKYRINFPTSSNFKASHKSETSCFFFFFLNKSCRIHLLMHTPSPKLSGEKKKEKKQPPPSNNQCRYFAGHIIC